jgi:hypothetical protein
LTGNLIRIEVAMPSLTPFLALLAEIEDPRRAEGKLYRLPHVVLFAIHGGRGQLLPGNP